MSHTQPIRLPEKTWTLISAGSAFYQVTSQQAIFTRESDTLPTSPPAFTGFDPAVRRVAAGLYVRFDRHQNESVWGYSPIGASYVSVIRSPNNQPGVTGEAVNKFGLNAAIDDDTAPEDIWTFGGLYPFATFTTAQALELISSSVEDDSGGDGAQEIMVHGLDGTTGLPTTETVTMNGQVAVALGGTWLAINRMHTVDGSTGVTGANEGTIHCQVAGAGQIVAEILPLAGQTEQAIYRAAANQSMTVVNVQAWFDGNQTGDATINQKSIGADCQTIRQRGRLSLVLGAPAQRLYLVGGVEILPLEWYTLRVESVSRNDTLINGEFDAVLFQE